VLSQYVNELFFVSLVFLLLVSLRQALVSLHLSILLSSSLRRLFLRSRRQQPHEVLVCYKVTRLAYNGNRHDVIVCIDLMHESTHHTKSFARFYDLLLTLLSSRLVLVVLGKLMFRI
jgi:hypothetical protein